MRISPILLTLLLVAVAVPAMAATPVQAAPEAEPAPREAAALAESDRDRDSVDRHCLRETGSRIRVRKGERRCLAFAGRVYSRDDLERTGRIDIADALRTLDPSIR